MLSSVPTQNSISHTQARFPSPCQWFTILTDPLPSQTSNACSGALIPQRGSTVANSSAQKASSEVLAPKSEVTARVASPMQRPPKHQNLLSHPRETVSPYPAMLTQTAGALTSAATTGALKDTCASRPFFYKDPLSEGK